MSIEQASSTYIAFVKWGYREEINFAVIPCCRGKSCTASYSRPIQFTFIAISVSSKKILRWAKVCFSAHAITQPCRHTNSETFQAFKGLCDLKKTLNLECCKCAKMKFHCANDLMVLRICAPLKEHWSQCIFLKVNLMLVRYGQNLDNVLHLAIETSKPIPVA